MIAVRQARAASVALLALGWIIGGLCSAAECPSCDIPGAVAFPRVDPLPDEPGFVPTSSGPIGLIPAGPSYGRGQQDVDDLFDGDFATKGGRLTGFDDNEIGRAHV